LKLSKNKHRLAWIILVTGLLAAQAPLLTLTATTANVSGAPDAVRFIILRWSTDAERDQLISAWTNPASVAAAGRGAAADDPFGGGNDAPAGGAAPAAAKGGKAGKGGKGKGGGAPAVPATPEGSLTAALAKAPTIGYLWSSEVAGYAIHYAGRFPEQNGSERVILVTDRRLGSSNDLWKPTGAGTPANYEFSVIELHLNANGEGEGKASLTGKLTVDKTFGLENYSGLPVIFKDVKRKSN
jgi:hypothetical protein